MTTEAVDNKSSRDSRWLLLWDIRLSHLYHQKRERFLDGVDRFIKFVTVVGSLAATAAVVSDPAVTAILTATLGAVGLVSVFYDQATKARIHAQLARSFKQLEVEVLGWGSELSNSQIARYRRDLASIELDELPRLGALVTHCHNELCTAHECHDEITRLPFWQKAFMNWVDFDQAEYPRQAKGWRLRLLTWISDILGELPKEPPEK